MSHFLMIFCLSFLVISIAVGQAAGSSCQNENGGCSHICVEQVGGHKCECPSPLKLKDDGRHCQAEGLQLTCDTNRMQIDLPRNLFHEMRDEHLRLIDPECGAQSNASFFSLETSHTSCGTTSKVIGGYIVYSNKVMEMPNKDSAVVTTVAKGEVEVPFSCYYLDREIVTAVGFKPVAKQLYVSVKGRGNYKLNLNFYKSASYEKGSRGLSNVYTQEDFPVSVKLRERLYFEASLDTHEKDLQVFASNCCSTPTQDHEATHKFRHALIVEGCPVDPSVRFHSPSPSTVQRFSVRAFKFLGNHPFVFIHCRIYVCDTKDPNSRCAQGCKNPARGGQASPGGGHQNEKVKEEGAGEKQSAPEKLHADKTLVEKAAHHIAKAKKKLAAHHEQKKETKSASHPMQKKSSKVKEKKVHSELANPKEKKTVHPLKKNSELKRKENKKESAAKPVAKDESDAKKDESEMKDGNQMIDDLFKPVMKRDVSHVQKDTTSGFVETSMGPFVVGQERRAKSRSNDGAVVKAKKNQIKADVKEEETKTGYALSASASDAVLVVMTVASVMALVGIIYVGRQAAKRRSPYEYTPLTVKTN